MTDEKWIEVFRARDYGEKGNFTEADIQAIADSYDPAIHEAPLTVDHQQEGDAYGWVESLKREGRSLFARVVNIVPQMQKAFEEKRRKKFSIELYPPGKIQGSDKQFPSFYFKALTTLGSRIPHSKGMADPEFSDNTEYIQLAFDEGETNDMPEKESDNKPETQAAKIETPETKKAPEVDAEKFAEVEAERDKAVAEAKEFSEKVKELEGKLEATEKTAKDSAAKFSEREKGLEARIDKLEAKDADNRFEQAFSEAVKDGRVTPAQKDTLRILFHESVAADRAGAATLKFGEKDNLSREQFFCEELRSRPVAVEFKEIASSTGPERGTPETGDDAAERIVRKNMEEQAAKGNVLTYSESAAQLSAKRDPQYIAAISVGSVETV